MLRFCTTNIVSLASHLPKSIHNNQAILEPSEENNTKHTYRIWREMNTNVRPNIDANRLANVRRDILKNKRLSDAELETIKYQIREKNEPTLSPPNLDAIQEGNNETEGEAREHESDSQKESTDDVNVRVDISRECLQVDEIKQKILDKWYEIKEADLKDRNSLPKIQLNRKAKELIRISNKVIIMIKESREKSLDINEVNELIYATAYVTTKSIGKKITKRQQRKRKQPFWKVKIEKEIKELRIDLSILTELTKDNGMTERKRRKIRRKYSVKNENDIDIAKEKVRQAKAQRVRRFERREKQFKQNRTFATDTKIFYRELGKKQIEVDKPLTAEKTEQFWRLIWEDEKHHNEVVEWLREQEEVSRNLPEQEWQDIEKEGVTSAIKKTSNWKSPG